MPYGRKSKHHGKTYGPVGRPTGLVVPKLLTQLLIYPTAARAKEAYETFRDLGISYLFTCVGQHQPLYSGHYQRARLMLAPEEQWPRFWEWIDEDVRSRLREPLIKEG